MIFILLFITISLVFWLFPTACNNLIIFLFRNSCDNVDTKPISSNVYFGAVCHSKCYFRIYYIQLWNIYYSSFVSRNLLKFNFWIYFSVVVVLCFFFVWKLFLVYFYWYSMFFHQIHFKYLCSTFSFWLLYHNIYYCITLDVKIFGN